MTKNSKIDVDRRTLAAINKWPYGRNAFMRESHFITNAPRVAARSAKVRPAESRLAAPSARPRVLMVGMHLTRTRGGISTLTAGILTSSFKDVFDVTYIASQAEDMGKGGKLLLAAGAVLRFLWNCLIRTPDLVYVHLGSNASLYREAIFILLGKLMRRRVVAHFHAGDIDEYYPGQMWLGRNFIRLALKACDSLIAVSNESARQLRGLTGRTKIFVIPNAIDTSAFGDADRTLTGPVKLLFVGAMGKLKGERDLVDAIAILKERGVDLRATFLGFGGERLSKYCRERDVSALVEHVGPISLDDRIKFFAGADIFVLPTYAEAMPVSVIEAMAAGLPVISTTVGGIPELIDDGVDGLLLTPGDVRQLAEHIGTLAADADRRAVLGRKARAKARQQMDMTEYAAKLSEILAQAVSRG